MHCEHSHISTHGRCVDCGAQVFDSAHLNKKGIAGHGAIVKKVQKNRIGMTVKVTEPMNEEQKKGEHDKVHPNQSSSI